MNPVVNMDESIGKTVGRRVAPTGLLGGSSYTPEDACDWQRVFKSPSVPRGVYRFTTHEEADAWLLKMITRARSDPNPVNPPSPTSGNSARS